MKPKSTLTLNPKGQCLNSNLPDVLGNTRSIGPIYKTFGGVAILPWATLIAMYVTPRPCYHYNFSTEGSSIDIQRDLKGKFHRNLLSLWSWLCSPCRSTSDDDDDDDWLASAMCLSSSSMVLIESSSTLLTLTTTAAAFRVNTRRWDETDGVGGPSLKKVYANETKAAPQLVRK